MQARRSETDFIVKVSQTLKSFETDLVVFLKVSYQSHVRLYQLVGLKGGLFVISIDLPCQQIPHPAASDTTANCLYTKRSEVYEDSKDSCPELLHFLVASTSSAILRERGN